jgi:hypothetical protein
MKVPPATDMKIVSTSKFDSVSDNPIIMPIGALIEKIARQRKIYLKVNPALANAPPREIEAAAS